MAIQKFLEDLNIISKLGDNPGTDNGLSTSQFRATFDKAGLLIQKFINETIVPALNNVEKGLSMQGGINMNGQPISGLNAPTTDDQAANMGYVNQQVKMAAPYNYAHNSDFTQFVAQAGVGGLHGTQAYAGDRWILDSGTVTGTANADGNGYKNIILNGTIRQKVENPPATGKAKVETVSGTATVSYTNGELTITSYGGVLKNVLLCDTETLPEYQPKGYGAELAECQRYGFPLGKECIASGYVATNGTSLWLQIPTPVSMRVAPTFVADDALSVHGVSNYILVNTYGVQNVYLFANSLTIVFTQSEATFTPKTPITVYFRGNPYLSADL